MDKSSEFEGAGFVAGELVSASELREFVFCERSWWLGRAGYVVSEKAQAQRAEGLAFHQQRAVAARKGSNSQALWWAVLLALAAAALLLMKLLVMSR
jgi:hypothetical protein